MARASWPHRGRAGADRHHLQHALHAIPAARAGHRAAISGLPRAAAQRAGIPAGVGAVRRAAGVVRRLYSARGHALGAGGRAGLCAGPDRDGDTGRPAAGAARRAAGGMPPRGDAPAGRPTAQRGDLAAGRHRAGVFAAVAELAGVPSDAPCVRAHHPLARAAERLAGRRGLLLCGCARVREQPRDEVGLSAGVPAARAGCERVRQPPAAGRAAPARAGRG